jgi:hypothetical protein
MTDSDDPAADHRLLGPMNATTTAGPSRPHQWLRRLMAWWGTDDAAAPTTHTIGSHNGAIGGAEGLEP